MKMATVISSYQNSNDTRIDSANTQNVTNILENRFLNRAQINALIDLFEACPIKKLVDNKNLKTFIDQPKPTVPGLNGFKSTLNFVKPKYLPDKSIKSILKNLKE